ncbi:MAG: hypothetical protein HOP19_28915 [Acidobacteria bacterium]|nr:hypothetical protein [Acidobacteriota bacterium]
MKLFVFFCLVIGCYCQQKYFPERACRKNLNKQCERFFEEGASMASQRYYGQIPSQASDRYVVILKNSVLDSEVESMASELSKIYKIAVKHVYSCQKCPFKGFAIIADELSLSKLKLDSRVERIVPDSVSSPLGDIKQGSDSDKEQNKFRRTINQSTTYYVAYLQDELPLPKISETANKLLKIYGGRLLRVYKGSTKSFLFQTTEIQAISLSQNEKIKYVETRSNKLSLVK